MCSSSDESSSSEDSHSSHGSQLSGNTNKTVRYDSKTKTFYLIPRVFQNSCDDDDIDSQASHKTLKRYLKQRKEEPFP